jgi:uncharacterized membrane protein
MQRSFILALVLICLLVAALLGTPIADAQENQPQTAQDLILVTKYPIQEAAIGDTITFPLVLRTAGAPQSVRLEVQGVPENWTATFRGDGKVVQAAYILPNEDTKLDLRLEPPQYVSADTYRFTLIGHGDSSEARLPIELIIKDKLPAGLTLDVEQPSLKGAPDTTFSYSAKLENGGDQEITVNLLAEAPRELQVDFKSGGKSVTSIPMAANESKTVNVDVRPYADVAAGSYDIKIRAQGGDVSTEAALTAEVVGRIDLAVAAPDGRLSGQAQLGATTPFKLIVQNKGSAPAQRVALSASPPAGWTVEFEPQQLNELPAGQAAEVTAKVKPTDQAVAGDYEVTFTAKPEEGASKTAVFRITVLTSTLWGIVGIGLIAIAVAVVGIAVMRFGRR